MLYRQLLEPGVRRPSGGAVADSGGRRDALKLARALRSGDLAALGVSNAEQKKPMRDLSRAATTSRRRSTARIRS